MKDFVAFNLFEDNGICCFSSPNSIKMKTFLYPSKLKGNPKGIVFLKHGFAVHSKLYSHIARKWAEKGFDVVAFDNKGHG